MTEKKENKQVGPLDVFVCPLAGISSIEASAGTGKTWAICGLYLRLIVETGLKVDQILVVTFTNAATAELKSRIRGRLAEALHALETGRMENDDPFARKFTQSIEQAGDAKGRASSRLKAALSAFEEAAIYTIHAFCQRTLGDIPVATAQPFRVEVEANDREVVRQVAADYWRRIAARYSAGDIQALLDRGLEPDWLAAEIHRVLAKPTARLVFAASAASEDRAARRALWLKRILLRTGPAAVRAAKRRRRVISYNDMLYNLHEALNGGLLPDLAGELQNRYPAALIDEFQDTDPLQFEIFRRIYSTGGTLFLVGDPKQAIYAFRNADLYTYLRARRLADGEWTLSDNQRSESGLISAVNALFGSGADIFGHADISYRPAAKGTRTVPEIRGDSEHREPLSVWLFEPGAKASPLSVGAAGWLAQNATAAEIYRLIAGGLRGDITIGPRPLEPRHIAVLVRTRKQGQTIKAALARYGIASVDLSECSVFGTPEAVEMERVVRAITQPARIGLVRAALSTVLMGVTAMTLARLNLNDVEMNHCLARIEKYRLIWQQSGFGAMWRTLMSEERVIERLLPMPGGERRITNLMHLMELTVAAEEKHLGMEGLLGWLSEKRAAGDEEEAAQLRLESDENLVQIVTKHKAKGLEWPIVFCPFIWQERGGGRKDGKVYTYHDSDELILDYTGAPEAKERQDAEEKKERVRLIYVALTRAVNRCYIAAGPFWQPSGKGATDKAARKSIMNWIAAANGEAQDQWVENKKATVQFIHQAWRDLAESGKGVGLVDWNAGATGSLPAQKEATQYQARTFDRTLCSAWRMSSYSSLSASARDGESRVEPEARDYDRNPYGGEDGRQEKAPKRTTEAPVPDILNFPAGPAAGHCLHAVFERIDFQDQSQWSRMIDDVLAAYPPGNAGRTDAGLTEMIKSMLADVMNTRLPGGFALGEVSSEKRLSELEFALPVGHLDCRELNALLSGHGRRVPELSFAALEGYLRGFIDLVFEHQGKWYVLDWKSNKTGGDAADYARERLDLEMHHHAYELQGLIYLTALHRYLQVRLPGYDYETHIGGILYLFVRGVRPAWPGAGVWHDLPEDALIESLDALFSLKSKREGEKLRG